MKLETILDIHMYVRDLLLDICCCVIIIIILDQFRGVQNKFCLSATIIATQANSAMIPALPFRKSGPGGKLFTPNVLKAHQNVSLPVKNGKTAYSEQPTN